MDKLNIFLSALFQVLREKHLLPVDLKEVLTLKLTFTLILPGLTLASVWVRRGGFDTAKQSLYSQFPWLHYYFAACEGGWREERAEMDTRSEDVAGMGNEVKKRIQNPKLLWKITFWWLTLRHGWEEAGSLEENCKRMEEVQSLFRKSESYIKDKGAVCSLMVAESFEDTFLGHFGS